MKEKPEPNLSIFDTFKTKKQELTGEAERQRSIIAVLAAQSNPTEKTRTAISQKIAAENGILWKNIYSGIFRDLDETLIPLQIVEEEGRLPLKRGPKALQEKGIPYYRLTQSGLLVALSLSEIADKEGILEQFFEKIDAEDEFRQGIIKMAEIAPKFTYSLFEKYVKRYCKGELGDLFPLNFDSFRDVSDESVAIVRECMESFAKRPKSDGDVLIAFLEKMAQNTSKH